MSSFTDLFVKRSVLATVISLIIFVLGLRSIFLLPIQQYPKTDNAVITVTTVYTGAAPDVIAGFITTPLENAIAQANGIDYMTSTSTQGTSTIKAYLRLNYDYNKALTEVSMRVNSVLNQLPKDAQNPTITVDTGESLASMYIGFYSDILASNEITDYLVRVAQPKLQAVKDVQTAQILGDKTIALRAWLDPKKLATFNLTAADVAASLTSNNYISAPGRTDGLTITVNLSADTDTRTLEEFKELVIKTNDGALVRLKDLGEVTLGAVNYDSSVRFDGKEAIYIGIKIVPAANVLDVIKDVRKIFPSIQKNLPTGLKAEIVYDATKFINSSIDEVEHTLIEAIAIVTLVIFLFLGTFRSVIIPIVTIPLSLVGTFFLMLVLGFTINLLTLLALVLAIGLVVDDAIIVVENVYRHLEEGVPLREASLKAARELASPIIAITLVIIAVYAPIGFMGGLTGALFTEFAFTLTGAVIISGILALTLSPMMCSRILKPYIEQNKMTEYIEKFFGALKGFYTRFLSKCLNHLNVVKAFCGIVLSSIYFLYTTSNSELAPMEDQGVLMSMLTADPNATLGQVENYGAHLYQIFKSYPETDHVFQIAGFNGLNSSFNGMVLKPWSERNRTTMQLQPLVQRDIGSITGAKVVIFQRSPLPGNGDGLPVQFVLCSTDTPDDIYKTISILKEKAQQSGLFVFLDTDLKIDKAQTDIILDRDKLALMGLTTQDVGRSLSWAIGQNYVNFFNYSGRAYKVIPQTQRDYRLNPEQLLSYYITTPSGQAVPLSTVATLKTVVVPQSITHFQQLNSATLSGVPFPGKTVGDAISGLQTIAKNILPQNYTVDYASQSRQYMQESGGLMVTFLFALIMIYLCLAALFESFRDPIIILISVPMSISGALLFINLGIGGSTINIYTQVGLVTLIGLISKNGILMVEFANELRAKGMAKRQAIEEASAIRLRPILMTTAAMVLGVIPLLIASGAGAASRFNIGLVIATGLSIGTLFTLFVVPAIYMMLSKEKVAFA